MIIDIAKDDNASVGTRAEAGKDAVGDKANELKHKVSYHGPCALPICPPIIAPADG